MESINTTDIDVPGGMAVVAASAIADTSSVVSSVASSSRTSSRSRSGSNGGINLRDHSAKRAPIMKSSVVDEMIYERRNRLSKIQKYTNNARKNSGYDSESVYSNTSEFRYNQQEQQEQKQQSSSSHSSNNKSKSFTSYSTATPSNNNNWNKRDIDSGVTGTTAGVVTDSEYTPPPEDDDAGAGLEDDGSSSLYEYDGDNKNNKQQQQSYTPNRRTTGGGGGDDGASTCSSSVWRGASVSMKDEDEESVYQGLAVWGILGEPKQKQKRSSSSRRTVSSTYYGQPLLPAIDWTKQFESLNKRDKNFDSWMELILAGNLLAVQLMRFNNKQSLVLPRSGTMLWTRLRQTLLDRNPDNARVLMLANSWWLAVPIVTSAATKSIEDPTTKQPTSHVIFMLLTDWIGRMLRQDPTLHEIEEVDEF